MKRNTWGHYSPYIFCVVLFSAVLLVRITLPIYILLGVAAVLVFLVLASLKKMRKHDRSLCERCIGGMPLNPYAAVEKHERALKLAHVGHGTLLVYTLFIVGADVAFITWPSIWFYGVFIIGNLQIFRLMHAHMIHHRLQPWCGLCKNGGLKIEPKVPESVIG
jgi:hypothetical protein